MSRVETGTCSTGADDILQDETLMTEITIAPDGRIFLFGASRQTLELLQDVFPHDPRLSRVLAQVRSLAQPRSQT